MAAWSPLAERARVVGMLARPSSFVAGALTVVALLASFPAAADPAPSSPTAPPAAAPLAPRSVPVAAPLVDLLQRRSQSALSGGAAAVSIGGILLLSSALAGGLQAACDAHCDHTTTIVGMASAGGALLAIGIPLILWGEKRVPVVQTAQGWVLRF